MNLKAFKNLIKGYCGLVFEGIHEKLLLEGLAKRMAICASMDAKAYFKLIQNNEHEFHELICLLTINETYFYREAEQFDLLVNSLIPQLLASKQDLLPLRILSAGCSTGEEIYSIAIALHEKYGESAAYLFNLIGGDIDKEALKKAQEACYPEYSFRSFPQSLRERYFTKLGNNWQVQPEIRQRVHFYPLNLLAGQYPETLQNFDVIFFRNVSIYFAQETRILVQKHLAGLLKESGILIVGLAETIANDLKIFNLVEENGIFYFNQTSAKANLFNTDSFWLPLKSSTASFDAINTAVYPDLTPTVEQTLFCPIAFTPLSSLPAVSVTPVIKTLALSNVEILNLAKEKRYVEAMQQVELALIQQPQNSSALLIKAYLALQQKNYLLAEASASQVLKSDHWSIDALVLLGLAAKWRNQMTEATQWFKQAAYACHQCWTAHYYLGELYQAEGAPNKARRAYQVVLQLLATTTAASSGFAVIPTDLPMNEVRFLCEHQLSKLAQSTKT